MILTKVKTVTIGLCIISIVCMGLSHNYHDCIHNKLKFPIHEINLEHSNHRRLENSNYQNIRIIPFWDSMTTSEEHQNITKKLVSSAIYFMANATKVIPVSSNIKMPRQCGQGLF